MTGATTAATADGRDGIGYMVQAAAWFAVMALLVKLAGQTMPTSQIVFGRGCVTLLLSAFMLWRAGVSPAGNNTRLLLFRGVIGSLGMVCFYAALVHLPLAEATVIHQTSPLFTALLAAWLLRERIEGQVLVAIVGCLAGVVLIAQPQQFFGGSGVGDPAALDWRFVGVGVAGSVLAAGAYVTVRRLGRTEHPLVVVFYFPIVTVTVSAPFAYAQWVRPDAFGWLLLVSIGVVTQLAQVAMTRGLARAPAGRATTVSYLQIAFAAVLGAAVFQTLPNAWSAGGIGLIVVSLLGTSLRRRAAPVG